MYRLVLFLAAALSTVGCGSAKSPGQAAAEAVARKWVASQGYHDPEAAEYDVEPWHGGWSVLINYLPSTPGDHTLLHQRPRQSGSGPSGALSELGFAAYCSSDNDILDDGRHLLILLPGRLY
jgi:hypothetical protein